MSEPVSTRLPPKLIERLRERAEEEGVSLGEAMRGIIEEALGGPAEAGKAQTPSLSRVIELLGAAKMRRCPHKVEGLCSQVSFNLEELEEMDLEPNQDVLKAVDEGDMTIYRLRTSPAVCALCGVHGHGVSLLPAIHAVVHNPYTG